jgi:hypothetical protein
MRIVAGSSHWPTTKLQTMIERSVPGQCRPLDREPGHDGQYRENAEVRVRAGRYRWQSRPCR